MAIVRDPLFRLARQRAVTDSIDIEVQLSAMQGARPLVTMVCMARDEAAEAMKALSIADAEDANLIRTLQNLIARYDNMVRWIRDIIQDGILADQEITEEDREDMLDVLGQTQEGLEEAVQQGLLDEERSYGT
jgi:hypothetical protein